MSSSPLKSFTLNALYERSIENFADLTALIAYEGDVSLTYGDVASKVLQLQAILQAQGISKGDHVALLGENMPYWGVAYFAITTLGAVAVPILPDFHPNEIRHILRHAECKGFIISEKNHELLYDESFEDLEFIINLDTLSLIEEDKSGGKLSKLLAKLSNKTSTQTSYTPQEDDTAVIIYTSGTSGHSKGVILSHKNLASNVDATKSVADIRSDDVFLSILPLAHTYECTAGFLTPFSNGSTVYYISKAPTPRVLLAAFEKIRPTFMLTVPLIIEKIYKNKIAPKFQGSAVMRALYAIPFMRKKLNAIAGKKLLATFGGRLRFFGIGGGKLSGHVESFLKEAHFPYSIGYGLTETSPIIAGVGVKDTRIGSTGPHLQGVEIKLINVNKETGEGEVLARGPNVMKGYYKDPEKTAEVIKDGWFHTEDLGRLDKDGFLYIQGRSKNVIVGPSGENIYPELIEALLGDRDEVLDSIVYEDQGKIVAKVHLDYEKFDALHAPKDLSEKQSAEMVEALLEELRVDLNSKVSSFSKVIKFIEQREPFEKTPTKKIKRYLYI